MNINSITRSVRASIQGGVLVGIAAAGIAIGGAAPASADGLNCQSGCAIDWDGTAGSFDNDGTNGISRGLSTTSGASHRVVSDACFVVSSAMCAPGATDPAIISESTGTFDGPGSAVDADGYQAQNVRGPAMTAVPGTKARPGTTATSSGGFYYRR